MNVRLGRIAYIQDEEEFWRRYRKGERQLYCWKCQRWQFPDACDHEGRETQREFDASIRASAKYVKRHYPTQEARLSREYRDAVRRGEL